VLSCYYESVKKKPNQSKTITNKRARYDYSLDETLSAGIILSGAETKSLRLGHGILRGSFVTVKENEIWLNNFQINPLKTNMAHMPESERTRPRKLLVTNKQKNELIEAKKSGNSIIPIKLITDSRYIKVVIGVGKGKKKYDKREIIKKRDLERASKRGEQ